MSDSRDELLQSWIRTWDRSSAPTWGIDSEQRIYFLNRRAQELLGVTAASAVGKPCHEVIKWLDGGHEPFCCETCPVFRAAQDGGELQPETLLLGDNGSRRLMRLLPMMAMTPDGSKVILVETAANINRWARIEGYLKKIVARDRIRSGGEEQDLTPRENEILELLADGFVPAKIATHLRIQYSTMRAHIHRILTKLGVSTLDAAIALCLLARSVED